MILMISSWISGKIYFCLLLVLHCSYMFSKYWVTLCLWIHNCHQITLLQSMTLQYFVFLIFNMSVFHYLDLFKFWEFVNYQFIYRIFGCDRKENKGNAKHGVSPRDLDLWPWKSIVFQIHLRNKYVPSSVKIHWRMLILECWQGCYTVKKFDPITLTFDLWSWK